MMVAENALKTVQQAIGDHRGGRIDLPARTLRKRIASLHGWIGEERLEQGDNRGARRHLIGSLRRWPWQRRAWLLLLAACGTPGFTRLLRSWHRAIFGGDAA
jgi:hypothetical protein